MIPLTNHDSRLRSEVFKNHPPRTGKPTVGRNACALPVPSTISYPQKNEIPKEKPHRLSQNFSTNPIPLTEDTPEPPGFLLDLFITWGDRPHVITSVHLKVFKLHPSLHLWQDLLLRNPWAV